VRHDNRARAAELAALSRRPRRLSGASGEHVVAQDLDPRLAAEHPVSHLFTDAASAHVAKPAGARRGRNQRTPFGTFGT
jgi:hypothetical protein